MHCEQAMLTLMQNTQAKTFNDCLNSKYPVISNQYWDVKLLAKNIYDRCILFLQINSENSTEMNIAISKQFAEDIIETRLDWRIEDIDYFFKFFRRRKDIPECCVMGNKITLDKLMQVVGAYEMERANEKVMDLKAKYSEPNEPILPTPVGSNPVIAEIYERLKPKEIEYSQREKSDAELLIQDYMREFDELYMRNPVEVRGKRFVEIENRMMEINDFLDYRLSQNNL